MSNDICIYDRVTLHNGKEGEVQFMGMIEGKDGIFYGIKLDEPQGKNNGTHDKVKYFECNDKFGIFVTDHKIKSSSPTQFNQELPRVSIGDRVHVKHKRQYGVLRFVGTVQFQQGCWYGVELEDPLGENNGSYDDRQYFECEEYYGVFCQMNQIESTNPEKKKKAKQAIKSNSDIAQIKNNYNVKNGVPGPAVAPGPPPTSPTKSKQQNLLEQDIESMGFIQLKARCGMEGLSTYGTKKQLLARLREKLQKSSNSNSNSNNNNTFNLNNNNQQNQSNPKHKKPSQIQVASKQSSSSPFQNKPKPQPVPPISQKQLESPQPANTSSNVSYVNNWDPDNDPELHDLDPANDDFFKPIKTSHDDDDDDQPERQGSVIYNRNRGTPIKANSTVKMSTLQEDAEEEPFQGAKPPLSLSKSAPEHNGDNINNQKSPFNVKRKSKSSKNNHTQPGNVSKKKDNENTNANDWIMLPDPNSGKMYYANLKTKETRWQPPPEFNITESNLNPNYNPQLKYQHSPTNAANQWNAQNRGYPPNPNVWQTVSTGNLGQYANQQGNQQQGNQFGSQQQQVFISPFTNFNQHQAAFQNNPQWTRSANFNNPNFAAANGMQQTGSPMLNPNMQNSQSQPTKPKVHKKRESKKLKQPMLPQGGNNAAANSGNNGNPIDALAQLEASKWKKTKDPSTGREYWYHRETKQTTWEVPPAVLKVNTAAQNAVSDIGSMEEIAKPDWDESGSGDDDYSGSDSASYYSDGSDSTEEDSHDDDQKQINNGYYPQQQQKQPMQNNNQFPQNQWNNQQQQQQSLPNNQWGNNNNNQWNQQQNQGGFKPMNNQWGNNNNGGNWGNNPNMNPQQQQQQPLPQNRQQPPSKMKKQDSARAMYLKPKAQGMTDGNNSKREEQSAEDNPWISAEEAKSRVIVRDTLKRYWQIGAEQSFKLDGWAKQNYQLASQKKGLFGKGTVSISDILSWVEFSKLKTPLNKNANADEKLKEQCMQTWKNINSYMGVRKSGKPSEGHVEKLVRYALKGDDKLRNEIYCQLAKQTTKNPKLQSLLKGWKLLLICCSFFPPSDEFVDFLACFIWNNTQQPNEIGQYAIKALHALDATMLSGGRKFPPLPLEIVKLENLQPIPLNIYFINGMKCKQVLVTSQTRAKQVIETLAQTFNFKHPEAFGLYEMEPNIPALLKMKQHYIKRELMSQQEKINDLIRMPFERELEDDDRMLDVIASWLKRDQSKRRKNDDGRKKKKHKSSKNVRFVLKVKTFRKSMEKSFSHMGAKANFLTHVWHVINGFYPINEEDEEFAFDLAALQLQGTYGPTPKLKPTQNSPAHQNVTDTQKLFYKPGLILYDLKKYLGHTILNKYSSNKNDCEQKILQVRATKYNNMSRQDCWLRYAKMLRSNKKLYNYFGGAWYRGVRIQGDNEQIKKGASDYHSSSNTKSVSKADRNANDLLVGINEHAITFVNPITQNVVERYQMEEILTFGYRSNAFLFVAGTLMTQTKMQIATMHGKAMNRLVRTHIDLRVRDAEKKGQKVTNVPKGKINDV